MAAVFRNFDQAKLDEEYNPRARAPDFQTYFDKWDAASKAARAARNVKRDIAYGPGKDETLDIYLPEGSGPRNVLVYFHGGFWRRFSKNDRAFIAPWMTRAGILTVVVDYTLLPHTTIDELIGQCRRSLVWVRDHIAGHGGNPQRIYAAGESAGGHIAAMMWSTDWKALGVDPAPAVRGALAISGIYELEPIRLSYLQPEVKFTPDQVARNSPVRLVRPSNVNLVLSVGSLESGEFQRQVDDYSDALANAGVRHDVVHVGGANHFSIVDCLGEELHPLRGSLMRLMRS